MVADRRSDDRILKKGSKIKVFVKGFLRLLEQLQAASNLHFFSGFMANKNVEEFLRNAGRSSKDGVNRVLRVRAGTGGSSN